MSIKIHHGPPGSYKTSSAMAEDFTRAVFDGRVIVTNVRGVTDPDRIRDTIRPLIEARLRRSLLPSKRRLFFWLRVIARGRFGQARRIVRAIRQGQRDRLGRFELIHLDTEQPGPLEEMRKFFHWAPPGAFFLIDEINTVFPKKWRDGDLAKYDYPDGVEGAARDNRPPDLMTALEKHRHYGWDFVLTTPHIRKVHDFLLQSAEKAYRHKNAASIGLSGRYWVYMHDADNLGKAKADIELQQIKKVPRWAFRLYASTAIGKTRDTIAGQNIFRQPGVIAAALGIVGLVWFAGSRVAGLASHVEQSMSSAGMIDANSPEAEKMVGEKFDQPMVELPRPIDAPSASASRVVSSAAQWDVAGQLFAADAVSQGDHWGVYKLAFRVGESWTIFDDRRLMSLGLMVEPISACAIIISYRGEKRLIGCPQPDEIQKRGVPRLTLFPQVAPVQGREEGARATDDRPTGA